MPRKKIFRVLHFGFDVDGIDVVLDKGGVDDDDDVDDADDVADDVADDDVAASIDVSCRPVPNNPENLLLFHLIPK